MGRNVFSCSNLVATTNLLRSRVGIWRWSALLRGWWSFPKADILSANLLWIPAESSPNFSNDVRYQRGSSPLSSPNYKWVGVGNSGAVVLPLKTLRRMEPEGGGITAKNKNEDFGWRPMNSVNILHNNKPRSYINIKKRTLISILCIRYLQCREAGR